MSDKAYIIHHRRARLANGDFESAVATAKAEYPFSSLSNTGRKYTPDQMMTIFIRDGFIDRYSGTRLVFPGTLRLLSRLLPTEFPFHTNWKMSECHIMYWELFPTVDHICPVARGGSDDESNWVTTSMLRNSAKSNWLLSELDWKLFPPAMSIAITASILGAQSIGAGRPQLLGSITREGLKLNIIIRRRC